MSQPTNSGPTTSTSRDLSSARRTRRRAVAHRRSDSRIPSLPVRDASCESPRLAVFPGRRDAVSTSLARRIFSFKRRSSKRRCAGARRATSEPRAPADSSPLPTPSLIRRPVERVGAVHTMISIRAAPAAARARASGVRATPPVPTSAAFLPGRARASLAPSRVARLAPARPARLSRAAAIPHAAASPRCASPRALAASPSSRARPPSPRTDPRRARTTTTPDPRGPSSARSSPSHSPSPPPSRSPTATWNHSSAR